MICAARASHLRAEGFRYRGERRVNGLTKVFEVYVIDEIVITLTGVGMENEISC